MTSGTPAGPVPGVPRPRAGGGQNLKNQKKFKNKIKKKKKKIWGCGQKKTAPPCKISFFDFLGFFWCFIGVPYPWCGVGSGGPVVCGRGSAAGVAGVGGGGRRRGWRGSAAGVAGVRWSGGVGGVSPPPTAGVGGRRGSGGQLPTPGNPAVVRW